MSSNLSLVLVLGLLALADVLIRGDAELVLDFSSPWPTYSLVATLNWVIGTIIGVAASLGTGLALWAVVGDRFPAGARQTNVGSAVILVVGALVTGRAAGAHTSRDWARAAILTAIAIVSLGVLIFVYIVATEQRR